jgi:hypothetical protein
VPGVADNQTEPTVDWRAAAMRAAEATHDPVIRESRIAAAVEQDWVTFGPQFRSAIWRELEVLNRNRNAADEILSRST